MPTENPKPAPGPEIKLSELPNKGGGTSTPIPSLLDAISAEANKNAPPDVKLAEPPFDPPPPDKTPPAQPQPQNPPKETPKPAAEPAPKKKEGIESVRDALERAEKRAKEASESATTTAKEKADAFAKVAELESKVTKYESDIEKDYKPRVAKLEQAEKEIQRTREILKIKAYQETPEFHDTYVKPLADARAEVNEILGDLLVTDGDQQRPATIQDFDEILAAKSINEAADIAERKFGRVSNQIVNYRQKIRSLERNRQEAVKNSALNAEEWEKRNREQTTEHQRAVRERILSEANRLIQGDANVAVPDDDTELKSALHEGQQLADILINGPTNQSQEEFLGLIGKGRAAIIKYPVLEKKYAKLLKEHQEAQEQLKQYQQSEPDVRGRSGGNGKPAAITSSQESRNVMLAAAEAASVSR